MISPEQIEVVQVGTGAVLFTLTTGPQESTYTLDDGSGLTREVVVYHRCLYDPCAVEVWPETTEERAYKKRTGKRR